MPSWFVALPMPAGAWVSAVPPAPPGARRVATPDLHLTVAFLGEVDEARARGAFETARRAALRRLSVRLGAVVPMGSPRRPHVFSALVEGQDACGSSIAEVLAPVQAAVLASAGLPAESRALRPHVTLLRLRRKASAAQRREALAWAEAIRFDPSELALDRIALYSSARDRTERAYDVVSSHDLAR